MASDRGSASDLEADDLDAAWFACDALHLSGYSLMRSPMDRAAERAATLARRVPRLYALRNLGPLLRLRQTLAACAAGGCDADATCAAVLTWMVALERGRRSA